MKFKLGHFVRFVDERYEGYITRIISEDMVGVTGDDDFEIPVPVSKITHVHGREPDKFDIPQTEATIASGEFHAQGIQLAVAADSNKNSVVYFYLLNTTSWHLLTTLTTEKNKEFKGEYSGIIMPGSAVRLYSASLPDLNIWPELHLQMLYYTSSREPLKPLLVSRKFRSKDFSGSKTQAAIINQAAWVVQLDEAELIVDVQKLKESFFKPAEEKQTLEKPLRETDLHIEKLRDDWQFLDSKEILDIQLAHFHKTLDAAIVHKLPGIILIHGTGNGTLRNHIHKTLSKHPQVRTFMDARKEKFGYGATEVFFK